MARVGTEELWAGVLSQVERELTHTHIDDTGARQQLTKYIQFAPTLSKNSLTHTQAGSRPFKI